MGEPGGEGGPAAFHLQSRWELSCPRERIWDELVDFHTWPEWWPGLKKVVEEIHGDPGGIGQRATSVWRGPVGYSLRITIEAAERVRPEFLRGIASGDVVGEGTWRLTPGGETAGGPSSGWTRIEFDWNVRANRRWIEVLAPVARPVFVGGHDHIMERGARGLADHLSCDMQGFSARVL